MADHYQEELNLWREYERRKKEFAEKCLPPEQYQKEIRKICEELGI